MHKRSTLFTLAALLFAVEDAHALPAAWLANRNAVIALLFGALAVGSHVRWRKGDGTRWGIAACVALVLGLFSGESALAAVGYLVAWEVFGANESKLRRGLALLPSAVVVVAWRVAYVRLGYRTWGSGLYIDPGRQPLEFLREAPARGLALIVSQWTQLQCDLYLAMPRALQLGLAAIGLCVVALLGGLFWKLLRTEREARFWAAGSVLSLIPACATFPMDRLLTFSGIGAFGLLAMQVSELGWLGSPSALPQAKQAVRWATGALVVLHLVLAAPLLCLRSLAPRLLSAIVDKSVRYVPENAPIREETWVVVNGFDIFLAYTPLIRGGMGMTVPKATEMMASMMADLEISRPDENTLVVRPDGGWLQYDLERLVCARSTSFAPGQRIRRKTMVVEILEVTSDRRPAAVAFHFEVPLEDPSIRWIQSKGLGGAPFSPPKVGERVRLAAAIPSWKL